MRGWRIAIGAVLLAGAAVSAAGAAEPAPTPAYDPRAAFAETDRNGDGVIDHEEFLVRITEVYYRADVDKDGVLTSVEVDAAMVHTEALATADSNKNGTLTIHEFIRARLRDYDRADTNGDGVLTIDEVVGAYQKPQGK